MTYHQLILLVKLGRAYGAPKIKNVGLTDTEYQICTFLYYHSGVSQDAVAQALYQDKTTTAKALLNLEKSDYITRHQDPANRRKNVLNLSEKRRGNMQDQIDLYQDWMCEINSCFTPEESQQFDALFNKLLTSALKFNTQTTGTMSHFNYL